MIAVHVIVVDVLHPIGDGDYLVLSYRIEGKHTSEEEVGRAASFETAATLLPPGLMMAMHKVGPFGAVEIWL